ncbi:MAG TPA: UDP-N-acetylmuramate dehydrogenase [Chlamydiales bacterium]|nr:UDP-N-acetylmuramate dehydrogenase [Chlamydiales bacterium]
MKLNWQRNRRFSEFSTFGIGGPISFFAAIHTPEEMEEAFSFARKERLPFFILGKGSNCLFADRGFEGVVLLNRIDFIDWKDKRVVAGGGASFSLLGFKAASRGFKGLEFAAGIPASVGGAVFMNAGASGAETQETLKNVFYLHGDGAKKIFKKGEIAFGYRSSSFQNMKGAILAAEFELEVDPKAREKQLAIIEERRQRQPLKEQSAGCIFRNPISASSGALIDGCGLKGFSVGGAAVSEIHANFFVNRGNATAQDVRTLIEIVQAKVFEQTNIRLETEIRMIG